MIIKEALGEGFELLLERDGSIYRVYFVFDDGEEDVVYEGESETRALNAFEGAEFCTDT